MNEIQRINPPSSVILSERKYPVITEDPSWSQIFSCLRSEDYGLLVKSVAAGAPIGYYIGAKSWAPRQGMLVGVLMCGGAALAHVVSMSASRLLGVTENGPEYVALVEQPGK